MMKEIRIHGRGGQGVVTAAELLVIAYFEEGKHALGFPAFGAERMGAPVQAFVRMDDKPIRLRTQVYHPDVVIVQDVSLIPAVNVLDGVREGGMVILNTRKIKGLDAFPLPVGMVNLYAVPATEMALEILGRATPNTTLLAAYAGITREVSLLSLEKALVQRFHGKALELNKQVVQRAYDLVQTLSPVRLEGKADQAVVEVVKKKVVSPMLGLAAYPGSSLEYKTGGWRTFRPHFLSQHCNDCGLCVIYCPEGVVTRIGEKRYEADYDYCKGCGICAEVCSPGDIQMEQEEA